MRIRVLASFFLSACFVAVKIRNTGASFDTSGNPRTRLQTTEEIDTNHTSSSPDRPDNPFSGVLPSSNTKPQNVSASSITHTSICFPQGHPLSTDSSLLPVASPDEGRDEISRTQQTQLFTRSLSKLSENAGKLSSPASAGATGAPARTSEQVLPGFKSCALAEDSLPQRLPSESSSLHTLRGDEDLELPGISGPSAESLPRGTSNLRETEDETSAPSQIPHVTGATRTPTVRRVRGLPQRRLFKTLRTRHPRVASDDTPDSDDSFTSDGKKQPETVFKQPSFISGLGGWQDRERRPKSGGGVSRASSFHFLPSLSSLASSLKGRLASSDPASSSVTLSSSSQAEPAFSSKVRRAHSVMSLVKDIPGDVRTAWQAFLPGLKRSQRTPCCPSEYPVANASATARADRGKDVTKSPPEDNKVWRNLLQYARTCDDPFLQKRLSLLMQRLQALVNTMREDNRLRRGSLFQAPQICQDARPQMKVPDLRILRSPQLVKFAKKAPQSRLMKTPGEGEAYALEMIVPVGVETKFTSLVRGNSLILKREGLFLKVRPIYVMTMRDENGQMFFLEILIVDCNELHAEVTVHSCWLRLEAMERVRKQTGLKISAISEATALASINDIWKLDLSEEVAARQSEGSRLYSVSPVATVTDPWITDLGSLITLFREAAHQAGDTDEIHVMRVNITFQVLLVVLSLDTQGILPRRFTEHDFALRNDGTILSLFSPSFKAPPKKMALPTKVTNPHQSRFSLARLLTIIWCAEELDYVLLSTVSNWQQQEFSFFPSCAPGTPATVKSLIVLVCQTTTVDLFALLYSNDFKAFERNARSIIRGEKVNKRKKEIFSKVHPAAASANANEKPFSGRPLSSTSSSSESKKSDSAR